MSPRAAAPAAVPTGPAPAVSRPMIYLGMDVHKDSIRIAVLPQSAKTPTRLEKLANDLPERKKWLERIAREARSTLVTKRAARGTYSVARSSSAGTRAR